MHPYTVVRSRRKTVAIHITKQAVVEVRAPLHMPAVDIERLLAEKEGWIAKHLSQRKERNAARAAFRPDYGSMTPLRGEAYPIRARAGHHMGFDGASFYLPPGLPSEEIQAALIHIYKQIAGRILRAKTAQFAGQMGVAPTRVTITSAKTRWGSCSGKNSLSFSWRLILADEDAIDYVVVHELAHIKEHNHSPRFWAEVAAILPDWKTRRERLKALQQRLSAEGWD